MLILGLKPGHDGAIAVLKDRRLLYSLEAEKDSEYRHAPVDVRTLLSTTERLGEIPDVVAVGGWSSPLGYPRVGAGYVGIDAPEEQTANFLGKEVSLFTSSHERSHLLMSVGMAPRDDSSTRAVLTWEGAIGSFYLLDDKYAVTREVTVMRQPGWRYAFLFALADPEFPDTPGLYPRLEYSGKLMALAAYGNAPDADSSIVAAVDDILTRPTIVPSPKWELFDSPLFNIGVEAEETKIAAALLTERIFEVFTSAARRHLPAGIPLYISGGCGLNCDWNRGWREMGHFSSVFVPPCTNDAGSALGTAIDALTFKTGDPYIDWSVYCGLEFDWDREPDSSHWERRKLDLPQVAAALGEGRIFAWVQGRWEMGPRALGNRSLLADPSRASTRDRLNDVKDREAYRPIAPCCRVEDLGAAFDATFEDPYMLYFRMVRSNDLAAVTHVDGSARCQTVSRKDNELLHELLSAFAERHGLGVLCNTSLNFKGHGFINRMSDLMRYCQEHEIDDMVVEGAWFERKRGPSADQENRITTAAT
jgi:hydroxymethyl cephem carbamoyltransferase